MSDRTVARRYAQALYEEAESTDVLEAADRDIALLRETVSASADLTRFFRSPLIAREKKNAVVKQLFSERVNALTLRFLRLLVEKEREDILPEIARAYQHLRDEQEGVVEATASVAIPVPASEERRLQQAIERMTGKRIRLHVRHDPGLIGGIVVRVGDTVYDGSVAHQLKGLRERLQVGALPTNGL